MISVPLDHFDPSGSAGTMGIRFFSYSGFVKASSLIFLLMGGRGRQRRAERICRSIGRKAWGDACRYRARTRGVDSEHFQADIRLKTYAISLSSSSPMRPTIDHLDLQHPGVRDRTFTFGGSYSGALSAWFRMAYPSHTRGSLSSSGVVNTVLDFVEFDEQVAEAVGSKCSAAIAKAITAFDSAVESGGRQRASAYALFGIHPDDLSATDFAYMVADGIAMADQYSRKDSLCAAMEAPGAASDPMRAASRFILKFWGNDFPKGCFYNTTCVREGPTEKWNGGTARCWRWQKCTQMAYLQAVPSSTSGVPALRSTSLTLEALLSQCDEMFKRRPDVNCGKVWRQRTLQKNASNIFFSDFRIIWRRASVRRGHGKDLQYMLVKATGGNIRTCQLPLQSQYHR